MKKLVCLISCLLIACSAAKADFAEHYDAAQQYLSQYQYSSAIIEFKKALRINYMDNSARVGLINSYLARGTYLANKDQNWEDAANDYRSAIFYLKYYPSNQDVQNSLSAIANTTKNLNQCLEMQKFDTLPKSRFQKAKDLKLQGLSPAAGYEFAQALADTSIREKSYVQIGEIMNVLGNTPKAAEYYQKAVSLSPDDAAARLSYARILDKLGQNDAAAREYNYALANGGDDPEILYSLERIYRKKLVETPDDAAAICDLGAILQKQNKFDEALQYYTQAGQLEPTNVTTRLNLGTLYQQRKSYDAAIAAYDSILTLYPNNTQAIFYKAQCLAAMGQRDQAIAAYKNVLSIEPTNKGAKSDLFNLLKTTMTPTEMMAYMNQNPSNGSNSIDDIYDYAIELHKQNKFDDAITCYNQVLKVKTDNPEVYLNLAIAYKQKGDAAQAKQILQNAKMRFPENKQIADNLKAFDEEALAGKFDEAAKYYNSGDFQKAITAYQSVQPPTFDSLVGIATAYKGLNNDPQAIEYYKKALALKSNSDIAYYIGVLYSEKEDWGNSKVYLKKAITINPSNAKAKDLLGSVTEQATIKLVDDAIALYDKANYIQSAKILNQILIENPKNAYALYYRGLIYDNDKKYALALADYKKAIVYNPTLTTIYYLIALDYDTLAQFKNALINYKKYVSLTTESNEYKTYSLTRIKELKKYEQ